MLPELRIEVEKVGDRLYRSRIKTAADGQLVCTSDFTFDPTLLIHIEAQNALERSLRDESLGPVKSGAAAGTQPPPDPIAVYGQRLFGYLVGNRADWDGLLKNNPPFRDGPIRLNIALEPEAAPLWSVPWEYLHDGEHFLALTGRWQIARVPWALTELKPEAAPLPLRILVAIASPTGQHELNVEREIELIQSALDHAQGRGLVKLDFLDFATLDDLRDALAGQTYHVLHFTGHGKWDEGTDRSWLAFEKDDGTTDSVTPDALCPLLVGKGFRLAVLSSCQGARTSSRDAFIGMGTALLRDANLPAVLAMQASILDPSAIELARVFYGALGKGLTIEEALAQVRLALWHRDGAPGSDWGIPALYLRTHELRLIDPAARAEAEGPLRRNVGGLPLPRGFVGRKPELRAIRRAVLGPDQRRSFVYLWGIGGIGKTALAAKVIQKLNPHVAGWAVVDCRRERMPLAEVLSTLANFLRGRSLRETQLAEVLLDSRLSIADRVASLAQNTEHDRFLFVFDNLETALSPRTTPGAGPAFRTPHSELRIADADPEWREFFTALFRQAWQGPTWLFTCRYHLDLLRDASAADLLECHLPGLNRHQAIMFMGNLARLSKEPLEDKLEACSRIGGHPKAIELLEGWLASFPEPRPGEPSRLRRLLDDPTTRTRLAEEWERYFLDELLGRLTDPERRALEAVSVFEEPFWWKMVAWITGQATRMEEAEADRGRCTALQGRWHELSLIQFDQEGTTAPWYTLHPVVREYLWDRLSPPERDRYHLRAADWHREQILGPYREHLKDQLTPDNENEWAAAALDQLANQSQDMNRARGAVETGLQWRRHLFAARRWEEADGVVNAALLVLDRWGQRDLAKGLLRESVETLEGGNKAVAQGNLATLFQDEGRLDEALATYEDVYRTFERLGAKPQMAAALSQIGNVYGDKGDYDRAIEKQQGCLDIMKKIGNEEGQAISLHRLSVLFMNKEEYPRALDTSRHAEAIDRRRGDEGGLASDLHQQGLILSHMDQPADAFARFQESLAIKGRIGDQSGAASSLGEIGKLLMRDGHLPEAIAAFTACLETHRRLNNPAKMAIDLGMLGRVHEEQGEFAAALEKYQQALALYRQYSPPHVPFAEEAIARVKAKLGQG